MTLPFSPRAKVTLRELLYVASETIHDGMYYLDGKARRSNTVCAAEAAFHEFTIAVNNGLLDDVAKLEAFLHRLDDVLSRLAAKNIDSTSLMVRRDYADQYDQQCAAKRAKSPDPILRGRPRLIFDADSHNT